MYDKSRRACRGLADSDREKGAGAGKTCAVTSDEHRKWDLTLHTLPSLRDLGAIRELERGVQRHRISQGGLFRVISVKRPIALVGCGFIPKVKLEHRDFPVDQRLFVSLQPEACDLVLREIFPNSFWVDEHMQGKVLRSICHKDGLSINVALLVVLPVRHCADLKQLSQSFVHSDGGDCGGGDVLQQVVGK